MKYLKSKGIEPGKYGLTDVDNTGYYFFDSSYSDYIYSRNNQGIIIKTSIQGGKTFDEVIGGVTIREQVSVLRTNITIHISPFDNIRNFTIAFNHELIHLSDYTSGVWDTFGAKSSEGSAWTYTITKNPAAIRIVPSEFTPYLFNTSHWPQYLIPLP